MMVFPIPMVNPTISGDRILGRIWRNMMRMELQLTEAAASKYSSLLTLKIWARVNRIPEGIPPIASASIVLKNPGPSTADITIDSKIPGIACTTSQILRTTLSTQPPK